MTIDRADSIRNIFVTSFVIVSAPVLIQVPITLGLPDNTVAAWARGAVAALSMLILWPIAYSIRDRPDLNRQHRGALAGFLYLMLLLPLMPPGIMAFEMKLYEKAQREFSWFWTSITEVRHGGVFAIKQLYSEAVMPLDAVSAKDGHEPSFDKGDHGITARRIGDQVSLTVSNATHASCVGMATLSFNDENNIRTRFKVPNASGESGEVSLLKATSLVINGKHRLEEGTELPSAGRLREMCEEDGQERIESATVEYILEPITLPAEEVPSGSSPRMITMDSVREACTAAFEEKGNQPGAIWLMGLLGQCYSDLTWLSYHKSEEIH